MENTTTKTYLIGLTGKYCAGKNYVASILKRWGFPVIDADIVGHKALELEKSAIVQHFGTTILQEDGSINRKKLGELVFKNPEGLAILESIVDPRTNQLIEEWISKQNGKALIINAAVLHKASIFPKLDCIIIVQAPVLVRVWRAKKRDNLPFFQIIARMRSQRTFTTQYLQKSTDIYYISNYSWRSFCNQAYTDQKVEAALRSILKQKGILE
jgi:dephospho-CoA kinase